MEFIQKVFLIRIKHLNFLFQRTTTYLKVKLKNSALFFKELNLLCSVSCAFYYQLLITPCRLVASKMRILSYWPAIITTLTRVDHLLVQNSLTFTVVWLFSNSKIRVKVSVRFKEINEFWYKI